MVDITLNDLQTKVNVIHFGTNRLLICNYHQFTRLLLVSKFDLIIQSHMLSLFVDTNSTLAMMISMVLKQQMLPVMQRIAGNTFVFQQDNAIGDSRRHQTSSLLISGRQTARTWTQSTTVFVKWWSSRFTRDHEAMVDSVVDEAVGEWRSPLRASLKVKERHFRTLAVIDWFLSEPPTFPRRRSYFSFGCVNKIDVAVRY